MADNTVTDAKFAQLQVTHGGKRLKVICYSFADEDFELVIQMPTRAQLQRFMQSCKASPEDPQDAVVALIMDTVVYPDASALLEDQYLAMGTVSHEILRLANSGSAASAKKPKASGLQPAKA